LAPSVGLAKEFSAHAVVKAPKKPPKKKQQAPLKATGAGSFGGGFPHERGDTGNRKGGGKRGPKSGMPAPPPPTPEEDVQQRVVAAAREWADQAKSGARPRGHEL